MFIGGDWDELGNVVKHVTWKQMKRRSIIQFEGQKNRKTRLVHYQR